MIIDGKEYLPVYRGRYHCPWEKECSDPNWPPKSWKTDAGFTKHLGECKARPDGTGSWKPAPKQEKVLWGLCKCGEVIYEGDTVTMFGDHEKVACIACFDTIPGAHVDCAGLRFPEITLTQ
jgi:hypothetical protein